MLIFMWILALLVAPILALSTIMLILALFKPILASSMLILAPILALLPPLLAVLAILAALLVPLSPLSPLFPLNQLQRILVFEWKDVRWLIGRQPNILTEGVPIKKGSYYIKRKIIKRLKQHQH